MQCPVLAFDIETVPDICGIRKLAHLDAELSDHDVAEYAFQRQRQKNQNDFLPHYLQRVIAIACVMRWRDKNGTARLHVASLESEHATEATLIQKFFQLIDQYVPQLVSWNGGGFDLPVLHYRAMIHGIVAPTYWCTQGTLPNSSDKFNWNHYLGRYHERHLDLMDVLSAYQLRAGAPLDDLAQLCGFAGKLGMDGSQVWNAYQNGQLPAIRAYCETDAANTYLMFLRFQRLRGHLNLNHYHTETTLFRNYLTTLHNTPPLEQRAHWQEFLERWHEAPPPFTPES